MPFVATQMDLEIIILNEVSQRKINIIWYNLYGKSKNSDTDEFTYKQKQIHRHRKQAYGHQREKVRGRDRLGASLVAQTVKRLPAMLETWVRSVGQKDPLEKEMATHSSTSAWKIPRTEEPGRLPSTGSQSQTQLSDFTYLGIDFGNLGLT